MDIFEQIGFSGKKLYRDIPLELIIQYTDATQRNTAAFILNSVYNITLMYSLEKNGHFLQVVEVNLKSPASISQISQIIQKAIRYRILFVFNFENRYILLWRKFKITKDQNRVISPHIIYCTQWIYEEELSEYSSTHETDFEDEDNEYYDVDGEDEYESLLFESETDDDNGDTVYFENELSNVIELNRTSIASEKICARALVDWWKSHSAGYRTHLSDIIKYLCHEGKLGVEEIADDSIFFNTSDLNVAICTVNNWDYLTGVGQQTRYPITYFEKISSFATDNDVDKVRATIQKYYTKYNFISNDFFVSTDDYSDYDNESEDIDDTFSSMYFDTDQV